MSYYKACKYIKTNDNIVIENFVEGRHAYWDKYNQLQKSPLNEGCTKYNVSFLHEYKELEKDFRCLISIQSMLINLIEKYVPNSKGKVRNIWRIIHAQKGTINFYFIMQTALKKYKIQHQNVYDALKKDVAKDRDRVSRNTMFVDTTIKDCGLEKLVNAIKDLSGKSMFEYTKQFSDEFSSNFDFTDKNRNFFEERDAAYTLQIQKIAKEYNIDLSAELNHAENIANEHYKKVKETIQTNKKTKKLQEKEEYAKELNTQHNINIFHCIEHANESNYLSKFAYENLIRALDSMNGHCYFITCVFGTTLQFYKFNGKIGRTMNDIAYFASKNDPRINDAIMQIKEMNAEAIISVEEIEFNSTTNINGISAITSKEESISAELANFHKTIYTSINGTNPYYESTAIQLASLAKITNNKTFYYICIVDNMCRAYGGKEYGYMYSNILAKSLTEMQFVQEKEYAEETIKKYLTDKDNDKYKFFIQNITIENPDKIIEKVHKQISNFRNELISLLETFEQDIDWHYSNIRKSTYTLLRYEFEKSNHLKIAIRKSYTCCAEILHSIDSNESRNVNDYQDEYNRRFDRKITDRIIISTDENGDKLLQNIIEKLQQYDDKHIYSVIDLSIDLKSEKYNSSKQKYIKRCCDDFKRTISYHLRNNEKTQDALKIETHLKDSQTIYFLYNYSTKVQYVSINCNHILRFASKPGQVKFFSDRQAAVEFAETLKNIHGINFQIDSYTYDGILTSYNYIFRLIKKESDALIKELNKDTMALESKYFTSQYQFDEIKQLLNTHEIIYIAFRKKINIHAQLMQLHDNKIPTCVNVKTIDFSQKELLFSSKITNSLLYATTKKDAEKIEKYMKSLDKSYVYRICELTTKTKGV